MKMIKTSKIMTMVMIGLQIMLFDRGKGVGAVFSSPSIMV